MVGQLHYYDLPVYSTIIQKSVQHFYPLLSTINSLVLTNWFSHYELLHIAGFLSNSLQQYDDSYLLTIIIDSLQLIKQNNTQYREMYITVLGLHPIPN